MFQCHLNVFSLVAGSATSFLFSYCFSAVLLGFILKQSGESGCFVCGWVLVALTDRRSSSLCAEWQVCTRFKLPSITVLSIATVLSASNMNPTSLCCCCSCCLSVCLSVIIFILCVSFCCLSAVVREGPEDDANSIGGYVVPFTLEVGKPSRGGGGDNDGPPPRYNAEERILVVGQVRTSQL